MLLGKRHVDPPPMICLTRSLAALSSRQAVLQFSGQKVCDPEAHSQPHLWFFTLEDCPTYRRVARSYSDISQPKKMTPNTRNPASKSDTDRNRRCGSVTNCLY